MVRRWSYINSINSLRPSSFFSMRQSAFDNTINSTMYLRKNYAAATRLMRRRWSRRKHFYGWLPMANVLKDWAQAYRFYRNYNKAALMQLLTRSSFLAFNLLSVKNALPCHYKNSEFFMVGTFSKKTLRYFSRFNNPRLRFLLSYRNTNLSVVSYNCSSSQQLGQQDHPFLLPLLTDEVRSYNSPLLNKNSATQMRQAVPSLLGTIFTSIVNLVSYYYRVLTLLTLLRLPRAKN